MPPALGVRCSAFLRSRLFFFAHLSRRQLNRRQQSKRSSSRFQFKISFVILVSFCKDPSSKCYAFDPCFVPRSYASSRSGPHQLRRILNSPCGGATSDRFEAVERTQSPAFLLSQMYFIWRRLT